MIIGNMTAAYTRLTLYDLLDKLQCRVLSFGPCLDDTTEFVSGEPKCYVYCTYQGETQVSSKAEHTKL